jgi:xylose isomerase
MNRLAVITAFMGGIRNRYMQYQPERSIEEKLALIEQVPDCDGVELCYPADFEDLAVLKELLERYQLGVAAINFRSRRGGKWWRGSFTSADPQERKETVDDLRRSIDHAHELGCNRVTTCPLNEGADVVFEVDFGQMYDFAAESLAQACRHNPDVSICLEYKLNDPRIRCLLGTAGETASFCQWVGLENLGATFDFGHSLLAQERPAQAVELLAKTDRLFYVHLNDNDGRWDWDMIPGTYHIWELLELLYTLRKLKYEDWIAFDVFAKEVDQVKTFAMVMEMTRRFSTIAQTIEPEEVKNLTDQRDPVESLRFLIKSLDVL